MNCDSIVVLDQAAGQKQLAILEAFKNKYKYRSIIAGTINERKLKLENDIVWEKTIPYNRSNIIIRTLSWVIFTIQSFIIVKRKYKNSDLFIITNPPLSIFLPFFLNNTFDVLVFDLYPDALSEYKYISKSSLIYRLWEKWNIKIYKKARRVFTLSQGMADKLSFYVDYNKIEVVPLWTDNSFLQPIPKSENTFVKDHGLEKKFTIMYSGNMGLTHPVELLHDLAEMLKDDQDILFLLIGGGHKYKLLEQKIKTSNLTNIFILPWQTPDRLPLSMNAADVGVVTLDAEASKLSVPSKIFDLFSIGIPILGIGSKDSELSKLLLNYDSGICFNNNQMSEMVNYILKLKNDSPYYNLISKNSLNSSTFHTPLNANKFI